MQVTLSFESTLSSRRAEVWEWITSVAGISRELWPYFRMTAPAGVRNLRDVTIVPGQPMFRSWVFLFGVLPIDRSELTLVEFAEGTGFVEESPMRSMRRWRHERRIIVKTATAVAVVDRLTFEPRVAAWLTAWFMKKVFEHRHRILRKRFGATAVPG